MSAGLGVSDVNVRRIVAATRLLEPVADYCREVGGNTLMIRTGHGMEITVRTPVGFKPLLWCKAVDVAYRISNEGEQV